MEKVLEQFNLLCQRMLNISVEISKSFDKLDDNLSQFDEVTRLFKIENTKSVEVITEIIFKLKLNDDDALNVQYNALDVLRYLSDKKNKLTFLKALAEHYYGQHIDQLFGQFELLVNEADTLLEDLLVV